MAVAAGIDSFVSNAEADAYHAARGRTEWAAAGAGARDAALRLATAYLDGRYRWRGAIAAADQPLGWPRLGAVDREGRLLVGIPQKLREAACELALEALAGPLAPAEPRGGMVAAEAVAGIAVTYAAGAPAGPVYPFVDLLLAGLHDAGTAVARS